MGEKVARPKDLQYNKVISEKGYPLMKQYTPEELNKLSKEEIVALLMQSQNEAAIFRARLEELQMHLFHRSTERLECLGQESAFNEAEVQSNEEEKEPEIEDAVVTRSKRPRGKLHEDIKGLPMRKEVHELSEKELRDIFGENGWKRLPDEVSWSLEYHPSVKEAVEHHTAVYAAKHDDRIVRAQRPTSLLAHSIATPSLVAAIMNAKYTNAVPLYRLKQEFERGGVDISVPTMSNWVIRCAERYFQPVYDRLRKELCKLHIAQADETPCQVNKDGRPANAKSYMFVYRSGEMYAKPGIVLYDYQKTRNASHLDEFLKEFSGILVSDAYSGYHALDKRRSDIRIAHCWAHARRDFADAVKLLKKGGPSKQRIKKTIAYQALERIGTMYALEDEWKDLTPEERLSRRQEHMKPLVEAYFAWVKGIDPDTVLSEKTKDGLQYSINQEKYLKTFLKDGEVPIDNSASERAIRPFCVGRSNWHVIDSIKGAQASAIVYSIVETAKANDLKPYEYLKLLLSVMVEHIYDTDTAYLDDLMPWSENLPDVCKKAT